MTVCVLDTDVVIAALDRADAHHDAAVHAVRVLADDGVALVVSLVNYAETLVRPAETERTLRAAVAAIDAMGIKPVAPTAPVARAAARLRATNNISLADGFALATARAHRGWVATSDRRVRRSLESAGLELAPALR